MKRTPDRATRALRQFRAPDETKAQERAWSIIRQAAPGTTTRQRRRPARRRTTRAVALAVAALIVLGVALSPAGASVRHWIGHAFGEPNAAPALFKFPTSGRVLVSGAGGSWIVRADGSTRRLGSWEQASWSPHAEFAAVTRRNELAAVTPNGTVRWTLSRPDVSDPGWYSPSGFRVAYRSGSQVRVVAGDGAGDHLVANNTAPVAPAWRPGHPYQLAYLTRRGALVVRDAGTGRLIWRDRNTRWIASLAWSADGEELLALGHRGGHGRARVYLPSGRVQTTITAPAGSPIIDGSLSPNGRRLALIEDARSGGIVLVADVNSSHNPRRALSGAGLRQLAWSPNGRWLLVSWPQADQWVFVRVTGKPRIDAVSHIARQLSTPRTSHAFPRIDGWCCTTGR